jgi:hypothetical protein
VIQEDKIAVHHTPAFDSIAEAYDADFTSSLVGILQRKRVYNLMWQSLSTAP